MIHVVYHDLDNLGVVAVVETVFGLDVFAVVVFARLELNDATCTFLAFSEYHSFVTEASQLSYLEGVALESDLKVLRMTGEYDFMEFEVVLPTADGTV